MRPLQSYLASLLLLPLALLAVPPAVAEGLVAVPDSYDFHMVTVGSQSDPQTFVVTNDGSESLTLGTATVTGDGVVTCAATGCPSIDATVFALGDDGCSGMTLAAGASCEVTALFLPTAAETSVAALALSYSGAAAGGDLTILLHGQGVAAGDSGFTLSGRVYEKQRSGGPGGGKGGDQGRGRSAGMTNVPVPEVTLTLQGSSGDPLTAVTDENGEYRFEGLEAGRYRITPAAEGYRFSPRQRTVPVTWRDVGRVDFQAKQVGR